MQHSSGEYREGWVVWLLLRAPYSARLGQACQGGMPAGGSCRLDVQHHRCQVCMPRLPPRTDYSKFAVMELLWATTVSRVWFASSCNDS